ncbi:hypothetical protein HPB50_021702 [Hyalomma asiaticum]|uniref:Uncharacterized protein n=1 Tax=Hyalomma asiaticum TaxID=266040 RepID=A0ACB7T9F7_HYAAI|nr:hypothetical protein HPB50_021702 [Hyalomma asiaticum]
MDGSSLLRHNARFRETFGLWPPIHDAFFTSNAHGIAVSASLRLERAGRFQVAADPRCCLSASPLECPDAPLKKKRQETRQQRRVSGSVPQALIFTSFLVRRREKDVQFWKSIAAAMVDMCRRWPGLRWNAAGNLGKFGSGAVGDIVQPRRCSVLPSLAARREPFADRFYWLHDVFVVVVWCALLLCRWCADDATMVACAAWNSYYVVNEPTKSAAVTERAGESPLVGHI